jgi:hypothetical protein
MPTIHVQYSTLRRLAHATARIACTPWVFGVFGKPCDHINDLSRCKVSTGMKRERKHEKKCPVEMFCVASAREVHKWNPPEKDQESATWRSETLRWWQPGVPGAGVSRCLLEKQLLAGISRISLPLPYSLGVLNWIFARVGVFDVVQSAWHEQVSLCAVGGGGSGLRPSLHYEL